MLHNLTDEALCLQARMNEGEAEAVLVHRYGWLVRACARPLFLAGGDSEDLIQEGMLGLLTAIRSFDPDRKAQFSTYAQVCVRSRLLSAVRSAQGGKHKLLNHSISFDPLLFDETNEPLLISANTPEDVVIGQEERTERLAAIQDKLSELEATILPFYLDGLSCAEISTRVGRPQKSVDNAIQRIRRKVLRQFSSGATSES